MQANKYNISLETAKLLKDCEVENKYIFANNLLLDKNTFKENNTKLIEECAIVYVPPTFPAFTWKEILCEYPKEFFWYDRYYHITCGELINDSYCGACGTDLLELDMCIEYEFVTFNIMKLLQQDKYKEADEYFRKHCILITN